MATAGTALDELVADAETAETPVGEDEGGLRPWVSLGGDVQGQGLEINLVWEWPVGWSQ